MIKMMNNLFMNKDAAFFFLSWLALEFSVSQEIRVFSLPHPLCETEGKSRICLISGLNLISEDLRKAEDVNVSCSFSTSEHFQQKQSSITASLIPAFIQRRLLTGRLMANLISDVNVLVYGPASEALRSNVSPSPLIFYPESQSEHRISSSIKAKKTMWCFYIFSTSGHFLTFCDWTSAACVDTSLPLARPLTLLSLQVMDRGGQGNYEQIRVS